MSGVSRNVGLGEEPEVSVRLADDTVRDTTLGRLRRPGASGRDGADPMADAGDTESEAAAGARSLKRERPAEPESAGCERCADD